MRIVLAMALCVCGSAAHACDVYSSEIWGRERTAHFDGQHLTLTDHGVMKRYEIMAGGTGVPYLVAFDLESPYKDSHRVREYDGVLIIDMEIFNPDCTSSLSDGDVETMRPRLDGVVSESGRS